MKMKQKLEFTIAEREETLQLYAQLRQRLEGALQEGDEQKLRHQLMLSIEQQQVERDVFGLNPILLAMQTALIVCDEIGLRRDAVLAILLRASVDGGHLSIEEVEKEYGEAVARILHGLHRIQQLYQKNPVVESENFRNLLLSFAEDMRVILIMIADRVNLMRQIRDIMVPRIPTPTPSQREGRLYSSAIDTEVESNQSPLPLEGEDDESQDDAYQAGIMVSEEAAHLYAPLAHKLGLYQLKSELEDLSLKYLEHEAYYMIKDKLSETKKSRDAYIDRFIGPISEKLTAAGLKFHIKGRTKSIHSIWQKMKKQKCQFEGVYDLFAIRIILDSPVEKEKMQCWQVYSIVTDMYQPNPKRLRDWLSVPKSNGYESLHITVLGPEQKWVEVQIRTERMDEIAERGVAAHWRYKGVRQSEGGLDDWLSGIRQMLESSNTSPLAAHPSPNELMDQFKMDLYEDEVFVFTPKGDLLKFPKGATVLDMAYHIHSKVGGSCVGARINNKVVTLRHQLHSGDQVEIMTSSSQKPRQEWLNIVKTSRAKSKIRLALKELLVKEASFAKEMIERKFKNRKIELDEPSMAHLVDRLGFKKATDFYLEVAHGNIDINTIIERYNEIRQGEHAVTGDNVARSADGFVLDTPDALQPHGGNDDVLVIDRNLKGIDYQLARCCNPIFGDKVFGFVTSGGGIKIHREDCPNAPELRRRYGYRVVKAKWSGKGASQYSIALRVVGVDDIGIVNNLTNIISKDERLVLRSISIDSRDGLFSGTLVVMLDDTSRLEALLKRLRTVKGVKQVDRA